MSGVVGGLGGWVGGLGPCVCPRLCMHCLVSTIHTFDRIDRRHIGRVRVLQWCDPGPPCIGTLTQQPHTVTHTPHLFVSVYSLFHTLLTHCLHTVTHTGLGKTVEVLALILSNPPPPSLVAGVTDPQSGFIQSRGTLVVCAVSLVGQVRRQQDILCVRLAASHI